ncbi:mycothiol synthase [Salirhabdus euzebyi]|uniref:Mycothiol synthase n=1 Tax=Salirhabdus euzebyi TaxID=394506 RepID=A0A841PZ32_9BACI|nr:GNAT family N-acetyltransferase [Salirhabdus euzebyi]MBB6452491.1 mycothiol synthase [Salirhabdus euzebyi]
MKALCKDYLVRSPLLDDASAVTDFVAMVDISEFGFPDIEIQDVIDLWSEITLNKNVWIIESLKNNQIIGYGFIEETDSESLYASAFVHPDFKGEGIGTHLLDLIDFRALEIKTSKNLSLKLDNVVPANNESAIHLLESKGYQFNRLYQRMEMKMEEIPESISVPSGVTIRPYRAETDSVKLHEAHQDSFKDVRDFSPQPYEQWIQQKSTTNYDQSLWFVAYAENELVGFIICKIFDGKDIYVDLLGTKKNWRKRGLASCLLNTVFRESFNRGNQTVLITVDSNSLTKANLLYEKVGFKSIFKVALFQKHI